MEDKGPYGSLTVNLTEVKPVSTENLDELYTSTITALLKKAVSADGEAARCFTQAAQNVADTWRAAESAQLIKKEILGWSRVEIRNATPNTD